ncbi:hypothetical protein TIFTF001_034141 [Ficus carica]|uniref:Uncharacterized protein n=1 Tax=Ficus carica TaxID=3494 RepID=A0AA88J8G5_FICCA|nr:hypothetical protein TIFTF001_034141 [Ficus carica]
MEKQSDGFRSFANDLTGETTFSQLNRDLQTSRSNLRRWGNDGCSRKLQYTFSGDMATATKATAVVAIVIGDLRLGFD